MNGLYKELHDIQSGHGPRRHATPGTGLAEELADPDADAGDSGDFVAEARTGH
jgi:hypothetical protein